MLTSSAAAAAVIVPTQPMTMDNEEKRPLSQQSAVRYVVLPRPALHSVPDVCSMLHEKEGDQYEQCRLDTNVTRLAASVCTMAICLPVKIRLRPIPGSPLTNPDFKYGEYLVGYTPNKMHATEFAKHKPINHAIGFLIRLLLGLRGNINRPTRVAQIVADFYCSCTFDLFLYYFLRNERIASVNKADAEKAGIQTSDSGYVCCYNHLFDIPAVSQRSIPSPLSTPTHPRPATMSEQDWRIKAKPENWLAAAQQLLDQCTSMKLSNFACHYLYCILCALRPIFDDDRIIPAPGPLWLRLAGDSNANTAASAAGAKKTGTGVASLWGLRGIYHRRGDTVILQRHGMTLNVIEPDILTKLIEQGRRENLRLEEGNGLREKMAGLGIYHYAVKIQYQSQVVRKTKTITPVKAFKQADPGPLIRRDSSGHYSSLKTILRRDDPTFAVSNRPKPKTITIERSQNFMIEDDTADEKKQIKKKPLKATKARPRGTISVPVPMDSDESMKSKEEEEEENDNKTSKSFGRTAQKQKPKDAGYIPMFYSHAELGNILSFSRFDYTSLLIDATREATGQTLPALTDHTFAEPLSDLVWFILKGTDYSDSNPAPHKRIKHTDAKTSATRRTSTRLSTNLGLSRKSKTFDEAKWYTTLMPEISRLLTYQPLSYSEAHAEQIGKGRGNRRGRRRDSNTGAREQGRTTSKIEEMDKEEVDEFAPTQPTTATDSKTKSIITPKVTTKRKRTANSESHGDSADSSANGEVSKKSLADSPASYQLRQQLVQTIMRHHLEDQPFLYGNCLRAESFRCPRIIPDGKKFKLSYATPDSMLDLRVTPACLEPELAKGRSIDDIAFVDDVEPTSYGKTILACPNFKQRIETDLFFRFEYLSQTNAGFASLADVHLEMMKHFKLPYRAYVFHFEQRYLALKTRLLAAGYDEKLDQNVVAVETILRQRQMDAAAAMAKQKDAKTQTSILLNRTARRTIRLTFEVAAHRAAQRAVAMDPTVAIPVATHETDNLSELTDEQLHERIALLLYEKRLSAERQHFFRGFVPVVSIDDKDSFQRRVSWLNQKFEALRQAQIDLFQTPTAKHVLSAIGTTNSTALSNSMADVTSLRRNLASVGLFVTY